MPIQNDKPAENGEEELVPEANDPGADYHMSEDEDNWIKHFKHCSLVKILFLFSVIMFSGETSKIVLRIISKFILLAF